MGVNQSAPDQQRGDKLEFELQLRRLVTEEQHAQESSRPSAQRGDEAKLKFRHALSGASGFNLVVSEEEKVEHAHRANP